MVNINELRIGNLVSTNGKPMNTSHKDIYKVLAIDSRDSFEEFKGCVTITCDDPRYKDVGAWCQYLEPIPLTPELLEKCGFEYSSNHIYEYKYDGSILFDELNDWKNIDKYSIGIVAGNGGWLHIPAGEVIIRCLYLHQLQNMYYAITGEELEVKL